jgi:hypothetical protein
MNENNQIPTMTNDIRKSLLLADPLLSRYNPLDHILLASDFDNGQQGWQTYFPDYDGEKDYPERFSELEPLDDILEQSRNPDLRIDRKLPTGPRGVPMLSTMTSWDVGTVGSWDGLYSLKIPTLPRKGDKGLALKRLGSPWRGKFRIETWFTYKAEPSDFRLGELDVNSFFVATDTMDSHIVKKDGETPRRWWPSIRYHNAENGKYIRHWQANFSGSTGVLNGPWEDIPGGQQDLAFNRSPTKYQWHYLRFTFDLGKHEYVDLNCAGQEFDIAGRKHDLNPPLQGYRAATDRCPGLVNVVFGIETNRDKRCFLFLDSIVVSATES